MFTLKFIFNKFFIRNERDYDASINVRNIQDSFCYLDRQLKKPGRLFFVRFGDGEFKILLKRDHRNYKYDPLLEKGLRDSFLVEDPSYLVACPLNYPYDEFYAKGIYKNFPWQGEMVRFLEKSGLATKEIYENPCIFQCMAVFKPKVLRQFLNEHVRKKSKMFIGSTSREAAELLYGPIDYYIKIPEKNAFAQIDEWWPEIEKNAHKVELVIPSAGSASNIIALRLWNQGVEVKLIDFGSIVDAVERKKSRSWIRLKGHTAFQILEHPVQWTLKEKLDNFFKDVKFFFRNQII